MFIAAITFIVRNLAAQWMSRDIENYKAQHVHELEDYKKKLGSLQFEHQTRYSLMHERRAEVISELYKLIVAARASIGDMTSLLQESTLDDEKEKQRKFEQRKRAENDFNEVRKFFDSHRLYLSRQASERADTALTLMTDAIISYEIGNEPGSSRENRTALREAYDTMRKSLPPVLDELESEFKNILGVED